MRKKRQLTLKEKLERFWREVPCVYPGHLVGWIDPEDKEAVARGGFHKQKRQGLLTRRGEKR